LSCVELFHFLHAAETIYGSQGRINATASSLFVDDENVTSCLDPEGPKLIILMSLGRSGSGSTWQLIGALTGEETPSEEWTGSNSNKSMDFFEYVAENYGTDGEVFVEKFCRLQREYPNAGVVGFKWKPFGSSFRHPASIGALKRISQQAKVNPPIQIIHMTRNPLDVLISQHKHNTAKASHEKLRAHCHEQECQKAHLEKKWTLPTQHLIHPLERMKNDTQMVDNTLNSIGVPFIEVTYERLYNTDDPKEWRRIFEFLGVGPSKNLSRQDVDQASAHLSTSHNSHKDTLENYENVRDLLTGTEFEELLH